MGLCKCPKRLITNQFCFQHRVNVCENCMVSSHSKCIVQSYLQWLNDSDYNSDCTLCNTELEKGDCVRLTCFHVFHWNCLNERQGSLPDNTAPGGHVCPICSDSIFPPSNLVSPVADILRSRLGQVNWGRNELGLPLFKEEKKQFKESKTYYNNTTASNKLSEAFNNKTNSNNLASPHSVLQIDSFSAPSTSATFQANSRRPVLPREERSLLGSDRDDNKYKRKTPGEIFAKWSRRLYSPSSRPFWRRTWFLVCFGIFMFLLLIFVMAKLGRGSSDDDDDSDDSILGNINRNFPRREII